MVGITTSSISVRWRLLGFIFFLLLMMIGAGTGGILGMKGTNRSLSSVYEDYVRPMEELRQLNELFKFDIAATAERVLYEQISFKDALATVEKAKIIIENNWVKVIKEGEHLTGNRDWLNSAKTLATDSKNMIAQLTESLQSKDMDHLDSLFHKNLEPFQQEYEAKINTFILGKVAAIKAEYKAAEKRYKVSQAAFIVTIVLGTVFGLVVGYLIMRSIDVPLGKITSSMHVMMRGDLSSSLDYEASDEFGTLIKGFNQMQSYLSQLVGQIQNAGIQVTSSITEIAASTKQQEVTANEHAATANEIAASTNQIAATSAHLQQTMTQVNSLTTSTAHAAEEGHAGLADIDKTMSKMEEATGTIVTKLSVLSEKAGDIAGVVKTITKVADQTNLLSLNAAIEAEKAGEYGAGFAVVATEIRRLADQTAVATYDIEQMVKGVQSAVSSAVMGIDKFAEDVRTSTAEIREGSERLEGVIGHVQLLMPQVTNIKEGIEAQSLGARQISEATGQLNEGAQQSAESLGQMSSTINQLQIAAQSLQEAISKFKVG